MIAIRGIRWREQQLSPGPVSGALLEEVNDPLMDDETDDENDELTNHSVGVQRTNPYASRIPPTVTEAHKALMDLRNLLRPPRNDGTGYKRPEFDAVLKERLESMEKFLWKYTDVGNDGNPHSRNGAGGNWTRAADETAAFLHRGAWQSQNLWKSDGYTQLKGQSQSPREKESL